ncbi:MAG: hypothetical protein R3F43_12475 [bacterium]
MVEAARRYISAYERLTGRSFEPAAQPVADRIAHSLAAWRS